jgi:formate dehydrogenase subunit delta
VDRPEAYDSQMSGTQHLVDMANDIGNFFRAEPKREDAIAGIAKHIKSYWTRRMREKLIGQLQHSDDGLDPLPREALLFLEEHPAYKPKLTPGGDAG